MAAKIIDIATGTSRHQKIWRNQQVSWESFAAKFKDTHRTAETFSEYVAASKDRQSEIKDVGGFVGGYITDGRRKPENIKHRQIVTLDVDFGHDEFWDDFLLLYSNEAVLYSTHKHCEGSPRFRLILPLSRPVGREEYSAISRRIAANLGIAYFDSSTFQAERLMYWPSTSKDGEYVFEHQKGDWLDADAVLGTYRNWKDVSEWPVCDNERDVEKLAISKQADPTQKKGVIGAFCRAFSIAEAIDNFLPEVYVPATEGRYTYTKGTTAAGAIVYNDLFLYSHHSTDPVSGILCNAFDLVRNHNFDGDQKAMLEWAAALPAVVGELGAAQGHEGEWIADMEVNSRGAYLPTIDNIYLILSHDEELKGCFAWNDFEHRDFVTGRTPWSDDTGLRYFTDKDDAGLRHYLEREYKIFHPNKTRDAVDLAAQDNSYHPVKNYLESLAWDGRPRLDSLFIDHLGALNSAYARAITRKALVAAVARVYRPGIKYDYVLTLVGIQGLGKSSIFRELGGKWYSDSLGNLQNKEAYEQIQGVWIVEMAELSSLKKNEVEIVKHFITKQEDRYRVAYGRRVETFKRQCVFFGTTNEVSFLKDSTGNRRFWPLNVNKKYMHGSIDVDQIWAEARAIWQQNEELYLSEDMEKEARLVQGDHVEIDDRAGLIERYLNTKLPENWDKMGLFERRSFLAGEPIEEDEAKVIREKVCVAEIWCEVLRGELRDMNTNSTKFIHGIMMNMGGWERGENKKFSLYGYQRSYHRVGVHAKKTVLTEN